MRRILVLGDRVELRWDGLWIPGEVVALYPSEAVAHTVAIRPLNDVQRRKIRCYRQIKDEGRDWRWPADPSGKE